MCTSDTCKPDSGCAHAGNNLPCDDGDACTTQDACGGGKCEGKPTDPKVLCNDDNPCTQDSCATKQGCTHLNNTAACNDGNGCTTGDVCSGGKCASGTNTCACNSTADCGGKEDGNFCNGTLFCDKSALPYQCKVNPTTVVTCEGSGDNACRQNQCQVNTGKCTYAWLNEGKACDADGSVCTTTDVCASGLCKPGATLGCDDGNACTNDSCDSSVGCKHVNANAACSDGNACTVGDLCQAGACASGPATTCEDGNSCTVDGCSTVTGACVFDGAVQNGKGCDADASVCTVGDSCASGACKAGSALGCDDANACTSDGCNPTTGCSHAPNNAVCNDGNACTGPDVCSGGVCKPAAVNCDDSNGCTIDSCDPSVGCKHLAVQDKQSCGPTNVCFSGVCKDGKCGDGVLMTLLGEVCDDGNTAVGDGCSATCKVEDTSCADGTREGMLDAKNFPKIAQCDGNWFGNIAASTGAGSPSKLCGLKFHVCNSSEDDQELLQSIPQSAAFQPGCWSINAANDMGSCQPCDGSPNKNDMAGIGKDCEGKITNYGTSCVGEKYRIDSADQTCVRPQGKFPWIQGVLCCAN